MDEHHQPVRIRVPRRARRTWRDLDERAGQRDQPAERDGGPIDGPGGLAPGVDSPEGWSRRQFMKLAAASAALATGCDRTVPDKILPYSVRPRDVTPGLPREYATHWLRDGFAVGLLVRSSEGRPTKVDGNPDHPASLGGSGLHEQALVLGVYDPDRAARVRRHAEPSSWEALCAALRAPRADGGAGLRLLLAPTSSPTIGRLLDRLRELHPRMKRTFHAPAEPMDNIIEGARLAFGRPLQPIYDLARADVVLTLDGDLLGGMPFALRYARKWAERRRASDRPIRVYAVECAPTVTGLSADHRLRRRSGEIGALAAAVALELPGAPPALMRAARALAATAGAPGRAFVDAVARDLASRRPGTTLVVVGQRQPPAVHAVGFAMNAVLGNVGRTVSMIPPVLLGGQDQDLGTLVGELRAGQVDTLVMLGGNPVYTAPADYGFARALERVTERIYLGEYEDETALRATWFAPLAHPLEAWGDGRAYDGTLSIAQPLLRPLRGGRTESELLAALMGDRAPDAHRLVLESHPTLAMDEALRLGLVPGSAVAAVTPTLGDLAGIGNPANDPVVPGVPRAPSEVEVNFFPSPTLLDGRFANNAWLLEQPEPVTKLTWGNAVLISPATAQQLRLGTEDLVEVESNGRTVRGPILVTPGHADHAVSLWLGYGHEDAGTLGAGVGFDAYRLRTSTAPAYAHGRLRRVPGRHVLARTQRGFSMHGRPIALSITREEYARDPNFASDTKGPEPSLMPPYPYEGLQWAMSIDLSICTGCSACMLACQSENDIPVVGKDNVLLKREMHWLRIDTYFHGTADDPGAINQPMMCQHCETAPCEYVCPVNATVHSSDGLNEMIYNRCVGTKFCSNNCPYKVRRFNWFNWNHRYPRLNAGSYELVHNPDVTVRDRGVMEKCTYCVQRIRNAEIRARIEGRDVRPGEVVTACQQACPTGAIQFGSLSHPGTPMVEWRREHRAYSVLNSQGTRPRTMYLARVDNPNPELP